MKATAMLVILFSLFSVHTYAQDYITGPWLWMIAPTEANQGGSQSIDVDSLAAASSGAVTEAAVAANGANEGDPVDNLAWTLGEIRNSGIVNTHDAAGQIDNVTDLVHRLDWAEGDVNDHSSYALITLESATVQTGVTMQVGSDDAIKVWLNGVVVHRNPVNRGSGGFQDTFPVDLKHGDNLLLVKVSEGQSNWSMFVGIDADVNAVYKPRIGTNAPQTVTDVQDYTQLSLPEGAKARLGKGWINEIAYSPDGTRLAVAGGIGIWLYDTATYQELALLTGHTVWGQ